ncbi:MAG TPA: hypothetical protein VGB71_04715, partial [Flavisolibacter sp.]
MRYYLITVFTLFHFFAFSQTNPLKDNSFGQGGHALINLYDSLNSVYITDLDRDQLGNTYLLGTRWLTSPQEDILFKIKPDGRPDSTFYENGHRQIGFKTLTLMPFWQAVYRPPQYVRVSKDGSKIWAVHVSGNILGGMVSSVRFKSNGDIDSAYGKNGYVSKPIESFSARDMVLTADGGFVVIGVLTINSSTHNLFSFKFRADGSIDSSYATNGKLSIPFTDNFMYRQTTELPGGSLLVTSNNKSNSLTQQDSIVLCKVKPNGRLDSSFGTNGLARGTTGSFSFTDQRTTFKTTLLADSAIIVLASTRVGLGTLDLYKFNKNGSVDNSFGTGGYKSTTFFERKVTSFFDRFKDPFDLKLWMHWQPGISGDTAKVVRLQLKPDGNIDSSFFKSFPLGPTQGWNIENMQSYGLAAENHLYFFGQASGYSFTVNKLNANAQLDSAFGENGRSLNKLLASKDNLVSLEPLSNGKMVGVSYTDEFRAVLFGLTKDGTTDSSFGNHGIVKIDRQYELNPADLSYVGNANLLIDNNNRPLTFFREYSSTVNFLIERFRPNGVKDSSFGTNGRMMLTHRSPETFFSYTKALVQPDNKILVLYETDLPSPRNRDIGILRLKENGSLDSSFGVNGRRTIDLKIDFGLYTTPGYFESEDIPKNFALLQDGSIAIAGNPLDGSTTYGCKLTSSGQLVTAIGRAVMNARPTHGI